MWGSGKGLNSVRRYPSAAFTAKLKIHNGKKWNKCKLCNYAIMHPLEQAICGQIWKRTVENNHTNATRFFILEGRQFEGTFENTVHCSGVMWIKKWKYAMGNFTLADQNLMINLTQFEASIWRKNNIQWQLNKYKIMTWLQRVQVKNSRIEWMTMS